MLTHVWFDVAVAFFGLLDAGLGCYLWKVGRHPYTWQRPIPIPKFDPAVYELRITNGSDVGFV